MGWIVCVCVFYVLLKIIKYTLHFEKRVSEIVIKSILWFVDHNFF